MGTFSPPYFIFHFHHSILSMIKMHTLILIIIVINAILIILSEINAYF